MPTRVLGDRSTDVPMLCVAWVVFAEEDVSVVVRSERKNILHVTVRSQQCFYSARESELSVSIFAM